jgi:hypothetical protein
MKEGKFASLQAVVLGIGKVEMKFMGLVNSYFPNF